MVRRKVRKMVAFVPRSEEFRKGGMRVGTTPKDALRYFVNFFQDDITQYSEGKRLDTASELGWILDQAPSRYLRGVYTFFTWDEKADEDTRPSWEQIMALHAFGKKEFQGFLDGEWRATLPTIAFRRQRAGKPKGKPQYRVFQELRASSEEFPKEVLVYRLAMLLFECNGGEGIRECPECKRVYVADRKDQPYCTPRCFNRVKARKRREKQRTLPRRRMSASVKT